MVYAALFKRCNGVKTQKTQHAESMSRSRGGVGVPRGGVAVPRGGVAVPRGGVAVPRRGVAVQPPPSSHCVKTKQKTYQYYAL